jgi:adenylosuccinate lyase
VVQRQSLRSWETGRTYASYCARTPSAASSDEDLDAAFDPAWYLRHVDHVYARFGL